MNPRASALAAPALAAAALGCAAPGGQLPAAPGRPMHHAALAEWLIEGPLVCEQDDGARWRVAAYGDGRFEHLGAVEPVEGFWRTRAPDLFCPRYADQSPRAAECYGARAVGDTVLFWREKTDDMFWCARDGEAAAPSDAAGETVRDVRTGREARAMIEMRRADGAGREAAG